MKSRIVLIVRGWFKKLVRRPSFEEWGLIVAHAVATRADCTRRKVGAVILDVDHRIIGAGYNGTYRGGVGCLAGGCPRALSDVASGSSYDTGPGACISTHAELNARLDVSDLNRLAGATMYVTAPPCAGCLKWLANTPITYLIFCDDEGETHGLAWPFQ